jgi:hypothetical protein
LRLIVAACAGLAASVAPANGQRPVPTGLRVLDSVRIQESDTLFVAYPSHLVLGAGGRVFLTDSREARILDIAPNGRIERVFGRKGRGPGEFESPTAMTMVGDTLLAVYDHSNKRVTFVDVRRWTLQRVGPLLTQWPPVIRISNRDLLVTSWDFDARTSIARVVEETGALDERQGNIPALGAQTQMLITGMFWNSTFVPVGDEIFAMYEVSNSLFAWKRGARDAREIALPVVRRRGIQPGFFESLLRDPSRVTPAMLYDRSVPVDLAPVSEDVIAIVTRDVNVDADKWRAQHHVTLYDRRRNRLCVDLEVPASHVSVALMKDPLPIVALRGDTLALLEQVVTQSGDPVQLLRRYRLEPSRCNWN